LTPASSYLIYGSFAAGAIAVYLLLPRPGRSTRTAGGLLGLAALAAVLGLTADRFLAPAGVDVVFYVSATVALVAAVKMITHERPVYSALYFVLVVLAVTPLLLLQEAEFLAVALVIIYAGAIMVTYVFVIMLSQQSDQPMYDRRSSEPFVAVFAGFVTMAIVAGQLGALPVSAAPSAASSPAASAVRDETANTTLVGRVMMSDYVVAFELAGVLLLVAMIGAIAVSRKRVPSDVPVEEGPPPGAIGRQVPPF